MDSTLLARIELHCLRHAHSGCSPGYHNACLDVLQIIRKGTMRMTELPDDPDRPAHDPTPQAIQEQCDMIRKRWPVERLAINEGLAEAETPIVPVR